MADPRRRTDMNDRGGLIQQEFHVIDEPHQQRGELDVEIVVVARDDSRARQLRE